MTAQEIRQKFLDFFSNKEHTIVPSAPIVIKNDPTLMFTNAGMNQFKDYFLGTKKIDNLRVANSQKCLRVSGKHNDLDEVGHDTYHHTMFEMLGNWSFGDYFKQEAIAWSWELLTEVYKIPKENLYVTVFSGDKKDRLLKDTEAEDYWKAYLPANRILAFNKKDNFWEMGESGPCGPCSEIHVDLRTQEEKNQIPGANLVNQDHPKVVEIWNLVFMEFFRQANGELKLLDNKHIDTGMGFERLAMVLQEKQSNYDTDVFQPIIQSIEQISQNKYGVDQEKDIAMRVIADHVRAVTFAIADGQMPSNNGAGYVIRRILRRAISYGYQYLKLKDAFIYQLVDLLDEQMGEFYPEIRKQKDLIQQVIHEEENSFLRTLAQGLERIAQIIQQNKKEGKTQIAGKTVFELYDTYGFPVDLSELVAKKEQMTIDLIGFDQEMDIQKNRARDAATVETSDWIVLHPDTNQKFIGYDALEAQVQISRYRKSKTKKGEIIQAVFNQTPFYAESGGQVGDSGSLISEDETIQVLDTKKENDLVVHTISAVPKNASAVFMAKVNQTRREKISKNHTATHLLHQALREILGKHVEQKGSYVGPERLRFDFSHFQKLSQEQTQSIEDFVNRKIQESYPLEEERETNIKEALAKGAMALFGEKYGDQVRTIQFGESIELCGGCHVQNTKDILFFSIESESSIAAGIRRIEAITALTAIENLQKKEQTLVQIESALNQTKNPLQAIEKLQQENQQLKKELERYALQEAKNLKAQWKQLFQNKNGVQFLAVKTSISPGLIKQICFQLKEEMENIVLVVASNANQKPSISVLVSDELSNQYHAGKIVKELAKEIQGGGGGQAFFATAGGKNLNGLDAVINQAKELI